MLKVANVFMLSSFIGSMALAAGPLPLSQTFEADSVGSAAGWESGYPIIVNDNQPNVIDTDASPAGSGSRSLHWLKPDNGSPRSGFNRRWDSPPSSTTGQLQVSYDFKIGQQTGRALSMLVSGWNPGGTVVLNVFNLRFDSDTGDGLDKGFNYLDNGNWANILPDPNGNQVIGHWFHYNAMLNVATKKVDLTLTSLDGGPNAHILGSFQEGNPLDGDLANFQGINIFQSGPGIASEVLVDNVHVSLVPEPGSLLLAGAGGLLILVRRRK